MSAARWKQFGYKRIQAAVTGVRHAGALALLAARVILLAACGLAGPLGGIFAATPNTLSSKSEPKVLPPTVKIAAILQTRGVILSRFKTPYIDALNTRLGLRIVLAVRGTEFVRPAGTSNVHLYAAGLDGGGRLRLLSPIGPAAEKINQPLYATMKQEGAIGFPVILRFAPTPLTTKRIRHLTGAFTVLYGGQVKKVRIPDIAAGIGKTLENPMLKAWRIQISILPLQTTNNRTFLAVLLRGPPDCFKSLRILRGKVLESPGYFSTLLANGATRITVPLKRPPTAGTSLELKLMVGQKKQIVHFHFSHVALP